MNTAWTWINQYLGSCPSSRHSSGRDFSLKPSSRHVLGRDLYSLWFLNLSSTAEVQSAPPVRAQELQPVLKFLRGREQLVLPENRVLLAREGQLVVLAHHDRLLGADLLAEPAENAAQHVDLEHDRIPLLRQLALRTLHFDRERRADPRAEAAGDAPLDALVLHEHRPSPERRGWIPPFLRVLARELGPEHLRHRDPEALHDLRDVELLEEREIPLMNNLGMPPGGVGGRHRTPARIAIPVAKRFRIESGSITFHPSFINWS